MMGVNGPMQKEMVGSRGKQHRLAERTLRHQDNGTVAVKETARKDMTEPEPLHVPAAACIECPQPRNSDLLV